MTRAPRAAIVGAGLMGRWHAHACRRAGGQVAAVIDVDPAAAGRLARSCGGAAQADSLGALPAACQVDVVHVCTPDDTHAGAIQQALARGCPVIVEKPVAPDAQATEALLRAAHEEGLWVEPVNQTQKQDGVRAALRWAGDRRVRVFDYRACSAGADASPAHAARIAAEILPHPLSLLQVWSPDAFDSLAWDVRQPAPGELMATAVAGDVLVRLLISMHARPTRHDLTLLADEGTMIADLFHGFAWEEPGARPSRLAKITRPFTTAAVGAGHAAVNLTRRAIAREPAYPGLTALVADAYGAVGAPSRRPFSDAHTLAVARARDAILRQAAGA
jgi:predicted dehydrogenase